MYGKNSNEFWMIIVMAAILVLLMLPRPGAAQGAQAIPAGWYRAVMPLGAGAVDIVVSGQVVTVSPSAWVALAK